MYSVPTLYALLHVLLALARLLQRITKGRILILAPHLLKHLLHQVVPRRRLALAATHGHIVLLALAASHGSIVLSASATSSSHIYST
jgi:hypothetical protein